MKYSKTEIMALAEMAYGKTPKNKKAMASLRKKGLVYRLPNGKETINKKLKINNGT